MLGWNQPAANFSDFLVLPLPTGITANGICGVIAAGPAKVHLDVQFTRYRIDNLIIGSYRSL
jgi:hypothetical protein